jgi:hypothetical protein
MTTNRSSEDKAAHGDAGEQQAEAAKLDAATETNLGKLGYDRRVA